MSRTCRIWRSCGSARTANTTTSSRTTCAASTRSTTLPPNAKTTKAMITCIGARAARTSTRRRSKRSSIRIRNWRRFPLNITNRTECKSAPSPNRPARTLTVTTPTKRVTANSIGGRNAKAIRERVGSLLTMRSQTVQIGKTQNRNRLPLPLPFTRKCSTTKTSKPCITRSHRNICHRITITITISTMDLHRLLLRSKQTKKTNHSFYRLATMALSSSTKPRQERAVSLAWK
mmetsp:Transcript_61095/g.97194  ORF Transcript_61095/g.97194 Transcript_61095/m.97194 type:complete len:232 (-) Transcript_61095:179-874(-)